MTLDAMARRYGQRPSQFIEGLNEFQAFTIDVKAASAGAAAERKENERQRRARG